MLSWLRRDEDVYSLVARKKYRQALERLEQEMQTKPQSVHLRQLQADIQERLGERSTAIEILEGLANELTAEGLIAKAIAMLKKIRRLDPTRSGVEQRLTALQQQQDGYFFDSPESLFVRQPANSRTERRLAALNFVA